MRCKWTGEAYKYLQRPLLLSCCLGTMWKCVQEAFKCLMNLLLMEMNHEVVHKTEKFVLVRATPQIAFFGVQADLYLELYQHLYSRSHLFLLQSFPISKICLYTWMILFQFKLCFLSHCSPSPIGSELLLFP